MDNHRPVPHVVVVVVVYRRASVVDRAVLVPDPVLFGVDRFYYVVPPVEELVADYLYHNPLLLHPFHHYHRHILVLVAPEHRTEHDVVYPAVAVVRYGNVVNPPVTVEVEVVDP